MCFHDWLFKTQLEDWFDEEAYVTTMYFVDPDIINSGGRTPEMFEAQGTGDRLVMRVSNCFMSVHE